MSENRDVSLVILTHKEFLKKYKGKKVHDEITKRVYQNVLKNWNVTAGKSYNALKMQSSFNNEEGEKPKETYMMKNDIGKDIFAVKNRYRIFVVRSKKRT